MPGPAWSDFDTQCMRLALRQARKAAGRTSPNPMVGAVLTRDRRIITTGYHQFPGGDHGEIDALKKAGAQAHGATLYLNLEPCSHYGRTPPCADALIRAGIAELVAGMKDPNPLVGGRGFSKLRRSGIEVRVGLLEEECQALNEGWVKYILRGVPFVTLKLAATLDGKIASRTGDAHWISGDASRRHVHRLRNQLDAVVIGAGTAMADDPQLTCRIRRGRNPLRVVLDSRLRIPLTAQLLRQRDPAKTIIVTGANLHSSKAKVIQELGAQLWKIPLRNGQIPWSPLLRKLARGGVVNLLIEGGAAVAASALKDKIVDKVLFFYAPKILGGDGKVMVDSLNIRRVKQSIPIERLAVKKSGEDVLMEGYL